MLRFPARDGRKQLPNYPLHFQFPGPETTWIDSSEDVQVLHLITINHGYDKVLHRYR
jgi:hypothetical protein